MFILTILLLTSSAEGWWCVGHMAVAEIAKSRMSNETINIVEQIFHKMSLTGNFPKSPDFMQAACWADDLKDMQLTSMAGWHFVNLPYNPSKIPINNPYQKENVETVIAELEHSLMNQSNAYVMGFALANLVHFYGDSHQPLHVTEYFSNIYPDGDEGGNKQRVIVNGTKTRLHFIWDSICWEYHDDLIRPLSAGNRSIITNLAARLIQTYKFSEAKMEVNYSSMFVAESYNDALAYAYPGTYDGMIITPAYLATCKPVAESRVALAGYRLGSFLENIFSSQQHYHPKSFIRTIFTHIVKGNLAMRTLAKK